MHAVRPGTRTESRIEPGGAIRAPGAGWDQPEARDGLLTDTVSPLNMCTAVLLFTLTAETVFGTLLGCLHLVLVAFVTLRSPSPMSSSLLRTSSGAQMPIAATLFEFLLVVSKTSSGVLEAAK